MLDVGDPSAGAVAADGVGIGENFPEYKGSRTLYW